MALLLATWIALNHRWLALTRKPYSMGKLAVAWFASDTRLSHGVEDFGVGGIWVVVEWHDSSAC